MYDDHPELASNPAAFHYFDWLRRKNETSYWQSLSGVGVERCSATAMVIGGLFDVFSAGVGNLNSRLNHETGRQQRHYLILGPWDHSPLPLQSFSGEREFGAAAVMDLAGTQQRFFDWQLRGASAPDWSRVRTFITGWNRWESWNRWPPAFRNRTFYLQPGGGLDRSAPPGGEQTFTLDADDPTPTLGGRLCCWPGHLRSGQFDQRPREARPDVVSFTSAPLAHDLLVVGAGAEIHSSSSSTPADIFATLVDVAPDGVALNLAEGIRRQDGLPGSVATFEISLGEVAHAFRRDHRIRLDVSGMSFPRFDRMPASGRSTRTIALGSTGSRLTLAVPESF